MTSTTGSRPNRHGRAALALSVAVAIVLSACSTGRGAADTTSAHQYRFVNATAPGTIIPTTARRPAAAVTGTLIGGGSYRLAAHHGKVVLINYWASWCAPCVTESPMLNDVFQALHGRGVDFVGIDIKDERQAARSFIADHHMTYPMIYDEPAKTALQLGIPTGGLPVTVLVDRAGRIAAVYLGQARRPDITPALQRLAAEKP